MWLVEQATKGVSPQASTRTADNKVLASSPWILLVKVVAGYGCSGVNIAFLLFYLKTSEGVHSIIHFGEQPSQHHHPAYDTHAAASSNTPL
jgi:hypothetical protein